MTQPVIDPAKQAAAIRALDFIRDGMTLGLGTGSTAELILAALGEKVAQGWSLRGVPTSETTASKARTAGIALVSFEEVDRIDVAIDGADEVSPSFDLIKGHGGALLREKVVAWSAEKLVITVDPGKLVTRIGEKFSLPIDVVPFAWPVVMRALERLGGTPTLRRTGGLPFVTDNGNLVIDCAFPSFDPLKEMDTTLNAIPGVVGHGLFIGLTTSVVVGYPDGRTEILGEQP